MIFSYSFPCAVDNASNKERSVATLFRFLLTLLALIMLNGFGNLVSAQQVIGTYPATNGGFEGATIENSVVQASAVANTWTKNNSSTTIAISTTTRRSGNSSLSITNSTATGRRVWSPSISTSSTTAQVTLQYYRLVASVTNTQESQLALSNGTTTGETIQAGGYSVPATAASWEKVTYTRNSSTFTSLAGVIFTRALGSGGPMFADDFVLYTGAVDNTAPSAPGSVSVSVPTSNSLNVSWGAAGSVDGGGYMVVRYTSNPNADNDPNVNGIYAVGNTITNGTGSLEGTIRYIGTGTSFTDNVGLASGTQYWYKVYTVDKAFNYSTESVGNGTTSAGIPTLSILAATNITSTSAQSGASLLTNGIGITAKGLVWSTSGTPVFQSGGVNQTDEGAGDQPEFTSTMTGLVPATAYNFRAYATNSAGIGYSNQTANFTTLAATPSAPTVSNSTVNSLTVSINGNGNGAAAEFAIRVNGTQFVQSNGTLGGAEVWQTAATWGNIVVSGLASGTSYTFDVKARNAALLETNFGPSANGTTIATGTPTVQITGTAAALNTTYGTASANLELSVSGTDLTSDISVAVPAGYQISTSATTGFSAGPLVFTQSGGVVTATPVFVRIAATTSAGSYGGAVQVSSSGATTASFNLANSVVSTVALTIEGLTATAKTYDRTTNVSVTGTPAYVGLVNGESFAVTGSVTYAFPTPAAGTNITLTATGTYAAPSANYTVTQPTLTASIFRKGLTLVGAAAQNKAFDGTNAAVITGTLDGIIAPDVVTLNGTGIFASVNASATPIVVTSTATLSGADANNYALAPVDDLSAFINQASQTINFPAIANRVIGDANFNLNATATSGLAVSYSSSNSAVATVTSSGLVTIVGVGTTIITASQAGNGNYLAATDATQTLTVNAAPIILAGWNFFGQTSPATLAATTFNSGLVSTSNANLITRGPGASSSSAANSFRTTGFQNNGINVSNTDYFQVTIRPATGNVISLNGITARFAGTGSFFASPGVTSQYAYSLDGTNFTLIGSAVQTTSLTPPTVDLSGVSALQNVPAGTTITIRYYASGQTTTGGWGFTSTAAGDANNGLSILGLVSAVPTVANPTVTNITTNSATLGAEVTNDGGQTLSARGTVWATTANPTTNALADAGITTGVFTQARTGFDPNTTYFFRGYATNATGTGYSADGSFTTLPEAPQVGAGSNAAFTSIGINWQAAANPGTATYTFEVQVDNNSDFSSPEFTQAGIASSINTLTAGGLTSGTEYFFRVRSTNTTGSSAWSATSAGFSTLVPQNPVVSIGGTPAPLTTTYGIASPNTSVSVGGFALTGNITVAAPAGFEVSTSATTGFASSIELTQTGGEVATTSVFVRLAATAPAGSYSGNISVSSTGATTQTLALAASIVNPATLTIVGLTASNKIYDRTTDVNVTGTPQYDGLANGESFAVSGSVTWAFPAVTVGANIALTRTGNYDAPSANYTVTQPTLTASIDPKSLTIDGAQAQNKPFDGTTAATITGTLNGVISPDVVTLVGTGTFAVATQGTGIPVTSTSTLAGAQAGNYVLIQPVGLVANITNPVCVATSGTVGWNFGTTASNANPSTNTVSGLVVSALTRGNNNGTTGDALLLSNSASTGYTGASGQFNAGVAARVGALNTAANGSAFFEITLTPNTGRSLSLTQISAGFRSTGTGPTTISVRTSLNGYASNVGSATISANSTWVLRTISLTGVQGASDQPITVRIYGSGGAGSASAGSNNWRIDDLTITATQNCVYSWSGNVSSDWNNTANWNFASIPGATDRVTIPARTNQPVIFQTAGAPFAEVGDLTLEAGAELTIDGNNNGQGLTINGQLTGAGAIKASANSTSASAPKANLALEGAGTHTLRFVNGFETLDNLAAWVPAGSSVELQSALTLYGDLTWLSGTGGTVDFNDNSVTLRSTALRTASVGRVTGSLTGATNVTVERFIPANSTRAWRLLAVPTFGAGKTFRSEWQEGATSLGQNPRPGFGTILTSASASAVANGYDARTASGSLLAYNEAQATPGWAEPSSTSMNIDTRAGYFVFIRGDRTQTPSTSVSSVTPTTLRTTGSLYVGDQPATSVNADQFKLVGNVYASAIDFTVLPKTGIDNTIWVWDPKLSLGGSLGAYQTFTGNVPFNFAPLIPGGSYSGPNSVIESGQAFFVKAGSTGGSIQLTEAAKTASANNVFRPLNNTPVPLISTKLYSATTNAYLADINYATFDPSFSAAVDGDDVVKFANSGENAAIRRDGNMLIVESRPLVSASGDTIAFQMWNLKQQAYRFEFVGNNMTFMPVSMVLVDRFLNTTTPISIMGPGAVSHNFTVTADAGSAAGDRFFVVLRAIGGGPLPVTFTQFNAQKQASSVRLNWTVSQELNIARYEVERSQDGRNFVKIAQVDATASSATTKTYTSTDNQPLTGVGYYRIKSVGTAGDIQYTNIVRVQFGQSQPIVTLMSNPVKGNQVRFQLVDLPEGRYQAILRDMAGKQVAATLVVHQGSISTQSVDIPSLAAGTYLFELVGEQFRQVDQLYIQN